MADSAKLYVNATKWELSDLTDMVAKQVENACGHVEPIMPPQFQQTCTGATTWMYYPIKKGPGTVMITKSHISGFPAWLIDLSARREKNLHILREIAKKIGGMYTPNESMEEFYEFRDPFMESQDFVLKLIQKKTDEPGRYNQHIDEIIGELRQMKIEITSSEDE